MKRAHQRVGLVALALALPVTMLLPGSASAGRGDLRATTIEVVAEGLDTPRGLTYDWLRHRILVAEAGDKAENNGTCAPGADGVIYCLGMSGAVFSYNTWTGSGSRAITGLASIKTASGGAVLGIHDLSVFAGILTGVFGLSGDQHFRDNLGAGAEPLGTASVLSSSGATVYGDLAEFEQVNNPEPFVIDSDPFGLDTGLFGTMVADAAGNDVLRVRADGTVSLVQVIPNRGFIESVPTTVVRGPDGAFYVGELSGYPYPVGAARVLRIVPGQGFTEYATGFTNIADILFDHKGRLVVLEMAKNNLLSPDNTGRLVRVEKNGTHTDLATTGLEHPGGVVMVGANTFYVTNRTTSTGNVGQLLKITVNG